MQSTPTTGNKELLQLQLIYKLEIDLSQLLLLVEVDYIPGVWY
jgi:hypothetical protein